jgi:hypothetical protein
VEFAVKIVGAMDATSSKPVATVVVYRSDTATFTKTRRHAGGWNLVIDLSSERRITAGTSDTFPVLSVNLHLGAFEVEVG